MKEINILSLCHASSDLSDSAFESYLSFFDIRIRKDELKDLDSLVSELKSDNNQPRIFDSYFIGYSISQIGKEFDLLRIGENYIVNIELKRENTGERIREQLQKNRYYLSFLNKDIWNFTYVSDENKLYILKETASIAECSIEVLASVLEKQKKIEVDDIDKLFNPSNYLVSPFNSTEAFLNGKYFLTSQQEQIKKKVMSSNSVIKDKFVSIYGAAGTGKTLLTYDIAKSHIADGHEVIIFHCGNLNAGHHKLRDKGFGTIESIKSINYYLDNSSLIKYDLVIFDEVQRIYSVQVKSAIEVLKTSNSKCIFSYDSKQCLANSEINRNIPKLLDREATPVKYKLTEKIRTNKEIASFIKNLFDLSKQNHSQKYSNIEIRYFSSYKDVKDYLALMDEQGWETINYTPSSYNTSPFDNYQNHGSHNAHHIIGQEFDKVVVVIDEFFYYNNEGKLSYRCKTYYNATKMLFQIVTRARKKLHIIILNNEKMLYHCLAIINRSDK